MPVLLIDDEADQASINTKSNRPPDPTVSDEDDSDDSQGPSKINALIRSILTRTTKAAYIAYTATPFATILINPDAIDRRVGDDLFPKDFVIQLPRPDGYTGTEELFGVSAQGRDVLRTVPEEDVQALRAKRGRTSLTERCFARIEERRRTRLAWCVYIYDSNRGYVSHGGILPMEPSTKRRDGVAAGPGVQPTRNPKAESIQPWPDRRAWSDTVL